MDEKEGDAFGKAAYERVYCLVEILVPSDEDENEIKLASVVVNYKTDVLSKNDYLFHTNELSKYIDQMLLELIDEPKKRKQVLDECLAKFKELNITVVQ